MLLVESRRDDIVCVYYIVWNEWPLFVAPVRVSAHTASISQQKKKKKKFRTTPDRQFDLSIVMEILYMKLQLTSRGLSKHHEQRYMNCVDT